MLQLLVLPLQLLLFVDQQHVEQMLQLYGEHPSEVELPVLKNHKKPQKPRVDTTKRADALRFALSQIVPKEHMEKVIEICAMICEVERK